MDPLRNAAEQKPLHTFSSVRAHDYASNRESARSFQNGLGDIIAVIDNHLVSNRAAAMFMHSLFKLSLRFRHW